MRAIDLNADLGETVDVPGGGTRPTADDAAMFGLISSASIACGGHAGDAASMQAAVALAAQHGVAVGAHPSYPDRVGFGRTALAMPPAELGAEVSRQLRTLRETGADIRYVKPHGALYHVAGTDAPIAGAIAVAVARLGDELGRAVPILADGLELARAADAVGLPFVHEAFLDRSYGADGRLVPRGQPGALLHDATAVAARAVRLARDGVVETVDGTEIAVAATSLCVHGDTPAAVAMAQAVRAELRAAGIEVRASW